MVVELLKYDMIVAIYRFVNSQLDRQDNFLDESQHLKDTDERYGPNLPKSPNLSIFAELLTLNGRKSTRLVLDDGQKEAYEDADEVAHEVVDRNARPRKTSRQKKTDHKEIDLSSAAFAGVGRDSP